MIRLNRRICNCSLKFSKWTYLLGFILMYLQFMCRNISNVVVPKKNLRVEQVKTLKEDSSSLDGVSVDEGGDGGKQMQQPEPEQHSMTSVEEEAVTSTSMSDKISSSSSPTTTNESPEAKEESTTNTSPEAESEAKPKTLLCIISTYMGVDEERADKPLDVTGHQHEDINYYYFLNSPLENMTTPGWQKIVEDPPYKRYITKSRWAKFRSFEHPTIQQECQVVMYTDSSTKFAGRHGDVQSFLNLAKTVQESEAGWAQPINPNRRKGISDEFDAIVKGYKDKKEHVDASLDWLRNQKDYVDHVPIYENKCFIYDMENENFKRLSDFFWDRYSLELDSWRDQPLWAYTVSRSNLTPIIYGAYDYFTFDFSRLGKGGHTNYSD